MDGASAIVLQAPSNLKVNVTDTDAGNHEIDPDQYVFRGWRIVDENGNPLENDPAVFYDPGETIMVRSYLARGNVIHMEAYYERKDSTIRRVDYTSLKLHANKDDTTGTGMVNREGLGKHEYVDLPDKALLLDYQQNNAAIHLKNYIKNFTNTTGSTLIGWDISPDGTEDYIPDYCSDAVIGIDNKVPLPNNLYAVWEPMVYLTLKNATQKDVTFTLSIRDTAAAYTEPINIVSDHLRTAFALGNDDVTVEKNSDDTFSVTLKKETEVKLSIPNGLDLQYIVSGNYLTQSDSTELYIYNSGDENNVSIKKENGSWVKRYGSDTSTHTTGTPISYSTDGTLILGTQGQMVLFSEDNPTTLLHIKTAYYNTQSTPNGWTISTPQEGPLATPAFVLEEGTGTESVDGYSVNLINNNQSVTFGLNVSHTNTQYKFIGWYTTCGAAPNTPTVKGVVNGFGEENINGIAVPLNETTYYALYVPYANDNLNVTHNQKEDSPGSCASGNGLTLSVTYNNATLTDEGDAADPALCSVAVDERALSPDVNYPIQIKVGALQAAPGAYDATFYNGQSVVGTKNTTTNYYEYTYDLDMKELLTASDSVKGLMKLNDVTFSSAFSLGYVITYRYTARDGRKHDYPRKISQL